MAERSKTAKGLPTLRDVAQLAGFSVACVSQVLGGRLSHKYPAATRQKVIDASKQLNYQPHASAQSMRAGRSNLIGLIHFGSQYEIARRASTCLPQEISAAGFDYLVIDILWYGGSIDRGLNEMIRARVEGVIIALRQEAFDQHFLEMFHRAGIPVLAIFGDERLGIPVVRNDMRSAHLAMARHLQSVGHRYLLMLAGQSGVRPIREKKEGFQLALADRGPCLILEEEDFFSQWPELLAASAGGDLGVILELDMARYNHNTSAAHYSVGKRLFERGVLPDAIMCGNDTGAFGIFSAALEMGVSIPGQMALTGVDNDEYGRMPAFSLTTIQLNVEGACAKAVEIIIDQIRQGIRSAPSPVFSTELVLRRSCGRRISPNEAPEKIVPAQGALDAP